MSVCGANLGPDEPINYPDEYIIDENFPVFEVETNMSHTECAHFP